MKYFLICCSLLLVSLVTRAELGVESSGDAFMSCSGYHQGSYLDFYLSSDGEIIYIEVSNDGEEPIIWPVYKITSIEKDGDTVLSSTYNDVLLKVTDAMNSDVINYGYVFVEATGPGSSQLQLNLNNYFADSFLVVDGFVEPLQCQVYSH